MLKKRKADAIASMPGAVLAKLVMVGEQIRIARKRRGYSEEKVAKLTGISRNTLRRVEAGDPGAGLGIVAMVLWVLKLDDDLTRLASPETDTQGKQLASYLPKKVRGKGTIAEADKYNF